MTCRDDAIKAVDDQWRGTSEIHARIGRWSLSAVRHALICMASEHLVESRSNPKDGYRLPQEKP